MTFINNAIAAILLKDNNLGGTYASTCVPARETGSFLLACVRMYRGMGARLANAFMVAILRRIRQRHSAALHGRVIALRGIRKWPSQNGNFEPKLMSDHNIKCGVSRRLFCERI